MRDWGQKRARLNALEAARELANRRAEIEDFEKFLAAIRSPIARSISPDRRVAGLRKGKEPSQ